MSGNQSHGQAPNVLGLIPGNSPVAKFFWAVVILFAAIYTIRSGFFGLLVRTTRDTVAIVGPDVRAAGAELGEYAPGVDRLLVTVGDKTYTLYGGKQPGTEYVALFGASGTGSSSTTFASAESTQSAQTVESLTGQFTGQVPQDAEARYQQYLQLVATFVATVGGQHPAPDFSSLQVYEVETARNLLAAMRANGVDVVNPSQWEAQLEKSVQAAYNACFQVRDENCVRDWGAVQTKVSIDPPGLETWLSELVSVDNAAFNRLIGEAVNTNAQDIASRLVAEAFKQAKAQRVGDAKARVNAGTETAMDIQWAFAGETVQVNVKEPLLQLPAELGGGRGQIDDADNVVITDQSGNSYSIPAGVAKMAIPNLRVETTTAVFSPLPALWNQEAQPWSPGVPLP